jgi:DUF4097 and DUF4098 domain-containing protein YvlB
MNLMRKKTSVWLIVWLCFLLLMASLIFAKSNFISYETNTHTIHSDFTNISIQTDTADISFVVAENEKCSIVCYEPENVIHNVTTDNGTLSVNVVDERNWYERIGIFVECPKLTIYLPAGEYGVLSIKEDTGKVEIPKDYRFNSMDIFATTGAVNNAASTENTLKIHTSTGSIRVEDVSANVVDLSVSTGKVMADDVDCTGDVKIEVSTGNANATNISCKKFISGGDTGDITLKNVIVTEKMSLERSTGDVKFEHCDAAEIFVETDTGDVIGSLLTDKVFITETDTGRINVPKTTTGGKCEVITDTGNIKINILKK